MSRLFQCPADKAYVIGSPASAPGLGDQDSGFCKIVFSGQDCLHDLSDHDQRRIAGVIIYIFKSQVYGILSGSGQYNNLQPAGAKCCLQQIKMKRRHVRAEDGIILPPLSGKDHTLIGGRTDLTRLLLFFPDADGGEKRADPDPRRSQIADLVDLQAGVDLAGSA